jgi:NAD+ kinase
MRINNVLIVYANPKNNAEKSALELVKRTLKKYKINYKSEHRGNPRKKLFQTADLVVAVGGDGTFLMASHFIFDKKPLLGVNSDPRYKEGFFMAISKDDFEEKFKKILSNNYTTKKLQRLEAYIGNKKIPDLALNEFYVASEKPYHTAIYFLNVGGKRERQKSSGILISSAAGSQAWIKSAGGKILPLESNKFQYLVREPYRGKSSAKCNLIKDTLNKNEKIEIVFDVGNGVLIADSLSREHKFKIRKKVTIKMSKKPLYCISFNDSSYKI